jgi:hypothetical protein
MSNKNKLPDFERKQTHSENESSIADRKHFKEMNKNLGLLICLVGSVKENLDCLSTKVGCNTESIQEIQNVINGTGLEEIRSKPGSITVKSSSTPISALTDDGHYIDNVWREAELTDKLRLRFTDPLLMESIATQTGADFLMLIRFYFPLFFILLVVHREFY